MFSFADFTTDASFIGPGSGQPAPGFSPEPAPDDGPMADWLHDFVTAVLYDPDLNRTARTVTDEFGDYRNFQDYMFMHQYDAPEDLASAFEANFEAAFLNSFTNSGYYDHLVWDLQVLSWTGGDAGGGGGGGGCAGGVLDAYWSHHRFNYNWLAFDPGTPDFMSDGIY